MIHPESVNDLELMPTTDMWCVPGLVQYRTQFLILDRCTAFEFERLDCFEFVTQVQSLAVADHFDTLNAARGMFEFIYEYEPVLETVASKPLTFTDIRTVEVRDHCFDGGAHG